jgi:D-psicose/D-tagatose/L-ribulose 3-epimerase
MKVGFNLLAVGDSVDDHYLRCLERIKAIGYDGIEFSIFPHNAAQSSILGRRLKDIGLQATFGAIVAEAASPISPDAAVRARARDWLHRSIDCGHALGGTVMIGPYHSPLGVFSGNGPSEDELSRCAEVLRDAADYAASAGIRLSIEIVNRFECYLLNTLQQGSDFRRRVGHPNFSYMYDTFHANIEEDDPVAAYTRFASEITYIHISENQRGVPGRGHVPWKETFAAIRAAGYDDWLTVEAFGRALPALASATRVWRDLFPDLETLLVESHAMIRRHWNEAAIQ